MAKWKVWLLGIWSALLSGAATTIGVMIADPKTFNLEDWKKLLIVAGISAGVSVINYLRQSPLPTAIMEEAKLDEAKEIKEVTENNR